jgi:uncharacterized protein (DUF2147 family)
MLSTGRSRGQFRAIRCAAPILLNRAFAPRAHPRAYAAVATILILMIAVPTRVACAEVPEGVWLVDSDAALQMFDCDGRLCGRVAWLRNVLDPTGQIQRDKQNPEYALRQRLVCGLIVIWGLQPVDQESWKGGWFYNPDDGKTYRAAARLQSNDVLIARIYLGLPFIGTTKVLHRVSRLSSEGWC